MQRENMVAVDCLTDGSTDRCAGGGRQDFMFSADLGCVGVVTGQAL